MQKKYDVGPGWSGLRSVADLGEGPAPSTRHPPRPLFLDQTDARRAE